MGKVDLIKEIQGLVRSAEEDEARAAVLSIRDPQDKTKISEAREQSVAARKAKCMGDRIINAVHQHWPAEAKEGAK